MILEDILNREDTMNYIDEFKINVKINRFGGREDNLAHEMIKELKSRNINISRHIRMLLALEREGVIIINTPEYKSHEFVKQGKEEKVIRKNVKPLSESAFV